MTLYGVRSEGMTTLIVTLFLFNESGSFRARRNVQREQNGNREKDGRDEIKTRNGQEKKFLMKEFEKSMIKSTIARKLYCLY